MPESYECVCIAVVVKMLDQMPQANATSAAPEVERYAQKNSFATGKARGMAKQNRRLLSQFWAIGLKEKFQQLGMPCENDI